MKLETLTQKNNPLLKRKEIKFQVHHEQIGTASRVEIRKKLAELLKTEINLVYIKKITTKTGTTIAIGTANIYESYEQAQKIEPKHIIARNEPPKKESGEAEVKNGQTEKPEEKAEEKAEEK